MSALGARVKRLLIELASSSRDILSAKTLLVAPFVASLALAGCAGNSNPAPAPKPTQPSAVQAPQPAPAPAPQPVAPAPGAKIGLLLPLSGQNANLGRSLLQAAEMGLFDVGDNNFTLLVEDTATPAGPDAAVRKLLASGANILLGPLFGPEVKRVAPIAQGAHVPLIAFTNDTSLAQNGVYVFGVTPQAQVQRVIGYAGSQGIKRYAILAPNSPYGRLVLTSFQEQVTKNGGQVTQIEFYDPTSIDFTPAVQRIADAHKTTGFDALMIPEGAAKLRQIAPLLPAFEIGPQQVHLLGTSLWAEAGLTQEQALAGGWYATTAPDSWRKFVARYNDNYGAAPDQRAALVYDAVMLAVALGKGPNGADYSQAALTNANGFSGVDGLFRLLPTGIVERGLAVVEITPPGDTTRDPAPTTFQPAIN